MNTTSLPTKLRELADRIEAAGVTEGGGCSISLSVYGVESREEVARWARLIGSSVEVMSDIHGSYLRKWDFNSDDRVGFVVRFPGGLLGGKVRTVVDDDAAGLAELLNQTTAAAPV